MTTDSDRPAESEHERARWRGRMLPGSAANTTT
jgi:hypothetical protein